MAETRNRTRRTSGSGRSLSSERARKAGSSGRTSGTSKTGAKASSRKVSKKSSVRTSSTGKSQAARKAGTKVKETKKLNTKTRKIRNEEIRVVDSDMNRVDKINLGDSYYNLIFGTIIMIIIGMLTVYIANGEINDLIQQFIFGTAGVVLMVFIASNFGTVVYKKFAGLAWLGSVILVLMLRTPLGIEINGATRWLNIMGISVQVVEIVKVCTIITSAYLLNKHYKDTIAPAVYVLVWGAAGIQAGLIIKFSSDLSSALVILLIAYVMTFVVMRNLLWHIFTALAGLGAFFMMYIKPAMDLYASTSVSDIKAMYEAGEVPYRITRILGWLHADVFQQDFAYQTSQSVRAIGSAGFLGKGLGSTLGTENFFAIESDFILAQLTSSFGILGLIGVLALFLFIVFNIIYTAANCRDRLFESLLCTGVATHFLCQNLINFCVATGAFPNTGIPFIFMSSGTTGLLINCWEIGIILAINKNAAKRLHKKGMLT